MATVTKPNPIRLDPTRTSLLRRKFSAEFSRRFNRLKQSITKLIVDEDALGLKEVKQWTLNAREFSSTQVNITDKEVIYSLKTLQSLLDPKDVIKLEDEPHITVRFGLHDLESDRAGWIISQYGKIEARLANTVSLFRSEENDVLKIDVESESLESLNAHLGILPNTQTHHEYHPHLTVAYLEPGTGDKYVGINWPEEIHLTFDTVVFSSKDKTKTDLPLVVNSDCGAGVPGSPGFQRGNVCAKGDRGAEDRAIVQQRKEEDQQIAKRREQEDNATEDKRADEWEPIESARSKEDRQLTKTREQEDIQLGKQREKEDKKLEKEREQEDERIEKARDKEDRAIEKRQEQELEATQHDSDPDRVFETDEELADYQAAQSKEWDRVSAEHDIENKRLEKSREEEDQQLVKAREQQEEQIRDNRESDDETIKDRREEEDQLKEETRKQQDKDLDQRWEREDESVKETRDSEDESLRQKRDTEDEQLEDRRWLEDDQLEEDITDNYDPSQTRVPAGSPQGGEWAKGGGRTFATVAEAEQHIVSSGLAGKAVLTGLTAEEASGVVSGLEKGLMVGNKKLKLRSIEVGEAGKETESFGFGYGTRGDMYIGAAGIRLARNHDREKSLEQYKDEPIGKRSFLWEDARSAREVLEIGIAHEVGHHVDFTLLIDSQKAVRAIGTGLSEAEILPLSGYASTHPSEMFAELHAAMSTGRSGQLTPKLRQVYEETLKTADPEPIQAYIRNELTTNDRWRFLNFPQKLEEFKSWLKQQVAITILAKAAVQTEQDSWLSAYIEQAYRKGLERAFDDTRKPHLNDKLDFYRGTKAEFLRSSFDRPVSVERVKLLAARSYDDLRGITEAMSTQISRELVDGMIKGESPREVARKINNRVDKIGKSRALTIARTETVAAHAQGQLDAFETLGVEELGVAVEWDTAKDGRVCERCRPLQGIVIKTSEAKGMIPRHPNCRCAFIPANVGEDMKGQLRTRQRITKAIDKSVRAEIPKKSKRSVAQQRKQSRWVGAGKRIAKSRPKAII